MSPQVAQTVVPPAVFVVVRVQQLFFKSYENRELLLLLLMMQHSISTYMYIDEHIILNNENKYAFFTLLSFLMNIVFLYFEIMTYHT